MPEPSRRTLQHPLAFWGVLALVAALGVGAVAGLAMQHESAKPIVVAG
jgi:hypothetical protein